MLSFLHMNDEPPNLLVLDVASEAVSMSKVLSFIDGEVEELFVTHRNSQHRGVFIGGFFAGFLGIAFPLLEDGYTAHWVGWMLIFLGITMLIGTCCLLMLFRKSASRSAADRARVHEFAVWLMLTLSVFAVAVTAGKAAEVCTERLQSDGRSVVVVQCDAQLEPYFFLPYLLFAAARLPRLPFLLPPAIASLPLLVASSLSFQKNGTRTQIIMKVCLSAVFQAGILVMAGISEYLERRSFVETLLLQEKIRLTQRRQKTLDVVVTSIIPRESLANASGQQFESTTLLHGTVIAVELLHGNAFPESFAVQLDQFLVTCATLALQQGIRRVRTFQSEVWLLSEGTDRVDHGLYFCRTLRRTYGQCLRIGLHFGSVFAVSTGVNYDIHGPNVSRVRQVKASAGPSEIYLTPELTGTLSPRQRATCSPMRSNSALYSLGDGEFVGRSPAVAPKSSQRSLYRGLVHLLRRLDERDAVVAMNQSTNSIEEWLGSISGPPQEYTSVTSMPDSATISDAKKPSTVADAADDGLALVDRIERRLVRTEGQSCCSWSWGGVRYDDDETNVRFALYFFRRLSYMVFAARLLLASFVLVGILMMGMEECWEYHIHTSFCTGITVTLPLIAGSLTNNRKLHGFLDVLALFVLGVVHLAHQAQSGRCVALANTTTIWMLSLLSVSVMFADLPFVPLTTGLSVVYVFYAFIYFYTQSIWPSTPLTVVVVCLCLLIWQGSVVDSVAREFEAQYQSSAILSYLHREAAKLERVVAWSVPKWAVVDLVATLEVGALSGPPLSRTYESAVAIAIKAPEPDLESRPLSSPTEVLVDAAAAHHRLIDDTASLIANTLNASVHVIARQGDQLVAVGASPSSDRAARAIAGLINDMKRRFTVAVHVGVVTECVFRCEALSVGSFGEGCDEAFLGLLTAPNQVGCYLTDKAIEAFSANSSIPHLDSEGQSSRTSADRISNDTVASHGYILSSRTASKQSKSDASVGSQPAFTTATGVCFYDWSNTIVSELTAYSERSGGLVGSLVDTSAFTPLSVAL